MATSEVDPDILAAEESSAVAAPLSPDAALALANSRAKEFVAIRLQSIYRGKKTRTPESSPLYRVPKSLHAIDYPLFVVSNENFREIPRELKSGSGDFAFVGCSGLKSLLIVNELIKWDIYTPSPDGYKHIPKLFIVDLSNQVYLFWQILKQAMARSKNLSDLEHNISEHRDLLNGFKRGTLDISEDIAFLSKLLQLSNTVRFNFFKALLEKATIILGDWCTPEPFRYIKSVCSQRIVTYASNIFEYAPWVSSRGDKSTFKLCSNFLRSIDILNPVFGIYTRTSLRQYYAVRGIKPDLTMFVAPHPGGSSLYTKMLANPDIPLFDFRRTREENFARFLKLVSKEVTRAQALLIARRAAQAAPIAKEADPESASAQTTHDKMKVAVPAPSSAAKSVSEPDASEEVVEPAAKRFARPEDIRVACVQPLAAAPSSSAAPEPKMIEDLMSRMITDMKATGTIRPGIIARRVISPGIVARLELTVDSLPPPLGTTLRMRGAIATPIRLASEATELKIEEEKPSEDESTITSLTGQKRSRPC